MAKKDLNEEINNFLNLWDRDRMVSFLRDIEPIFSLYDIDEDHDWVKDQVGEEDLNNVRLVRTVYLISKLADHHSGFLCYLNIKYPKMWKCMIREGIGQEETSEKETEQA